MTSDLNPHLILQLTERVGELQGQIGSMTMQLEHGAKKFDEIGDKVDHLQARQNEIVQKMELIVAAVADMKPKVAKLMVFMGRVGSILAVASAVMFGVLSLITASLSYVWDTAKAYIASHFH